MKRTAGSLGNRGWRELAGAALLSLFLLLAWRILAIAEHTREPFGRLVGVGILDLGRTSVSSVYFYFDPSPEIAPYAPGNYSALQEIAFCQDTGREYLYLGLYVEDCDRLNYKARYKPHERLQSGNWRSI